MNNWILVRTKGNSLVKVRQSEPFATFFVDNQGNRFNIDEIDMTEVNYEFTRGKGVKEEDGLDGYRVIYG